jgi:hypothetical protein
MKVNMFQTAALVKMEYILRNKTKKPDFMQGHIKNGALPKINA